MDISIRTILQAEENKGLELTGDGNPAGQGRLTVDSLELKVKALKESA